MKRSFCFLFASAALVAIPASAHAESGRAPDRQVCEVAFTPDGVSIPANVPALVARKKVGVDRLTIGSITPPRDRASFRNFNEGLTVLDQPDPPFEVGTQTTLEWQIDCNALADPPARPPYSMSFTATPAVPLPTTIGTVIANTAPQAYPTVRVQPSAELDAFLPVTRITVRYNGSDAVVSDYGERSERGPFELLVPRVGDLCQQRNLRVHEATLEVRAHVAGATSDPPPLTVNALFDCSAHAAASQDGGADDAVDDTSGGGCQTAPAAAASSFLTVALGLVVAGALRRLRKRQ